MTYLSYDQGGYNLSELEMVHKLSKIKIAHHIATSTDQRIKLVREFQDWKEHHGFTFSKQDGTEVRIRSWSRNRIQ